VQAAVFEILEIQKILDSKARITLIPQNGGLLPELLASRSGETPAPPSVPPLTAPRSKGTATAPA
jgi:hypothetical protein